MSEAGQGQTFNSVRVTSALPLITDSEQTLRHVGYGPIASFRPIANKPFDQFVGYSITLLASTRNDSGIASPSAFFR
jgi:hypothetical protein